MSTWGGLLATMVLMCAIALPAPSPGALEEPACATAQGWLFLERDTQAVILDPPGHREVRVDLAPASIDRVHRPLVLTTVLLAPRWDVERVSGPGGYEFTVRDPDTSEVVVSSSFERRIEIAASTVSPSGRFTVFIQANNVASEITVLDAAAAQRREMRLPHQEKLAAFAVASAFSRDERCLAISMERVDGNGPETWLVDLETGNASAAVPGFVIGWA